VPVPTQETKAAPADAVAVIVWLLVALKYELTGETDPEPEATFIVSMYW
jgi:hypothetical protein